MVSECVRRSGGVRRIFGVFLGCHQRTHTLLCSSAHQSNPCTLSLLCYKTPERNMAGNMAVIIAFLSQKSGVGKSTFRRLDAR